MLPFKSIDAATVTGAGDPHDLETAAARHTLFVVDTSGLTTGGCNVDLQGSLDGVSWLSLASAGIGTGQAGPALATVDTHLVRYLRANLTSISGGRVITAWLVSQLDDSP